MLSTLSCSRLLLLLLLLLEEVAVVVGRTRTASVPLAAAHCMMGHTDLSRPSDPARPVESGRTLVKI